jgi:hypothetical protein
VDIAYGGGDCVGVGGDDSTLLGKGRDDGW